jgi:hypothetical protein
MFRLEIGFEVQVSRLMFHDTQFLTDQNKCQATTKTTTCFQVDLLQDPHCPCVKTSFDPPQSELKYCWGLHRILEFSPMCKYQMTSITKTNN